MSHQSVREETLDPRTAQEWDALRALGHQMIDDMFGYLQTLRERPVWQPIPAEVKATLKAGIPHAPEGAQAAYEEFLTTVLPYPIGNIHPRFWGWVVGTGTATGALSEFLGSVLNSNIGGAEQIGSYVEMQVINWCKEMIGYPADGSGILVSGASMANLVGLTVARNVKAGYDIRQQGITDAPRRMMFYASVEVHSCIPRAVEVLGLGRDSLRLIPADSNFEMDLTALESAIAADRAAGHQPVCVIGTAGTVNTGAFDNLAAIADLCARENLWFHVDGAFGALAAIAPSLRHLTAGMDRADSLAFDVHKWMFVNYEAGVAIIRSKDLHHKTFNTMPDYLTHGDRGAASGELWFGEYGIQLSRGFRALKVWMSLKEHGIDKYARIIEQNVEQARYLAERVDESPELERLAPVPLNIVCFRYRTPEMNDVQLDALNDELVIRLQEGGVALASSTRIHGRLCVRPSATNHRSTLADFDVLVNEVIRLGREIHAEMTG